LATEMKNGKKKLGHCAREDVMLFPIKEERKTSSKLFLLFFPSQHPAVPTFYV